MQDNKKDHPQNLRNEAGIYKNGRIFEAAAHFIYKGSIVSFTTIGASEQLNNEVYVWNLDYSKVLFRTQTVEMAIEYINGMPKKEKQ